MSHYTVILSLISLCIAQDNSIGSCNFSRDCQAYHLCKTVQDAGCSCIFGQCVITGNPFFRGSECDKYTDCNCRDTPETCFCKDGFCRETRWECHEKTDCARLSKCKNKDCTCSDNLCEHECDTDMDCKDFHCNTALGYTCKCENSLCAYKQKSKECRTIGDCVQQGLCQANTPCACTQEYCTLPWWVQDKNTKLHCRSDKDCEDTILDCGGGKCSCLDMVPFNSWESRGTCVANNLGENNTKGGKVDDKDKKKKSGDAKRVKPKLNNDRIRFPTDVASGKGKEEFFSIKKLEY